jgi:anthranilate synthase/aminodeoxychorismate synthase-like glutamine amidotransferase
MILFIDNYDSFTYNLVQYFGELCPDIRVFRNDKITLQEARALDPSLIVISPGPGTPDDSGVSLDLIKYFHDKKPIFGVCLGHQAIGQVMGGKIIHAQRIMHGKTSSITHNGDKLFSNISSPFTATRYHSLAIEPKSMPSCLQVIARSEDNEIMGVKHKQYPVYGVQFHPESILTTDGKTLIANILNIGGLHG